MNRSRGKAAKPEMLRGFPIFEVSGYAGARTPGRDVRGGGWLQAGEERLENNSGTRIKTGRKKYICAVRTFFAVRFRLKKQFCGAEK